MRARPPRPHRGTVILWQTRRASTAVTRAAPEGSYEQLPRQRVADAADVLEVLAPIWHEKPDTTRRVLQRVSTVMQWAVAMEFRTDKPCDRIRATLGRQRDVVLSHRDVGAALETVQASRATTAAKLAFEFLVPTATRSGEVRLAQWTESIGRPGCESSPPRA